MTLHLVRLRVRTHGSSTPREFVWTPTDAQGPGTYLLTFSVTDGILTVSEVVTIAVNEANVALVLTPIGPRTVDEGKELRFTISDRLSTCPWLRGGS